ncbi:MAG: ATP-binding cassette domain-containing protein [Sphingobacteriales bacterium]|nr:MAG: ATP-binding cassette domain-containing protein [Sphingobacteriales bacterium]
MICFCSLSLFASPMLFEVPKLIVDSVQISVGDRNLVTDLYLECKTGEVIGIYGRNGCGKSMLFKSIFGTHTPQQIFVSIDGKKITRPYLRPGLMGYLPQFPFMPESTNIKRLFIDYGNHPDDFFNRFPDEAWKYSMKLGQLSSGQARLIEFYLILTGQYQFVLLDEPFTFIAPVHIETFQRIISEERKKKGLLITDHQHQYVQQLADRDYILDNGALKAVNI